MAWATLGVGWLAAAMEGLFVVVIYVFMATLSNNLELPSGRAFDWLPESVHNFVATALITSLGLIIIVVIVGKSAIVVASNALVSAFVDARSSCITGTALRARDGSEGPSLQRCYAMTGSKA